MGEGGLKRGDISSLGYNKSWFAKKLAMQDAPTFGVADQV